MSPSLADSPTLTPPAGGCPGCGTPLPDDAPAGLCPRCLLSGGLFSAATSGGGPRFAAPGLEDLARRFPDLELRGVLGRGGMGAVYLARQVKLDRDVALKVLPPEVGRDPAFAQRFLREARTLARLNHPHIVQVFDFGQTPGDPDTGEPGLFYFLMEYVDGANLRDVIAAAHAGTVEPAKSLEIVRQVCTALQFAHARGVVHRDVKPENILLDRAGTVKIADFGLAKLGRGDREEAAAGTLTGTRQAMGTPHYMAPEQARGTRDVDHRADIYSLGVVFYELLTGELPLGRFAPPSARARTDVRLDEVVLRALESDPADRYQSVTDVQSAVDHLGLPKDPATPAIGGLAAAPHLISPASPSPLGGAASPGNVRVTVNRAGRWEDPARLRALHAASERSRDAALGVTAGVAGLAAVGGATFAALSLLFLPASWGPGESAIVGAFVAGCGALLHLSMATTAIARRTDDPLRTGRHFPAAWRALLEDLWLPLGAGVGVGWAARGLTRDVNATFFGGLGAALCVAAWRVGARDEPPAWWPPAWGWKDRPPLAPVSRPVTPRPGRASALRDAPPADPGDRPAEVRANLRRLRSGATTALTGLCGAGVCLAIALLIAGLFVVDWSDDPLAVGCVLLVTAGLGRLLGGLLLAARSPNPDAGLLDARDCAVTAAWTALASAAAGLGTAVGVSSRSDPWNANVVLLTAAAGLLAAGYVTARRPAPPAWWPPGWAWKPAGTGPWGLAPAAAAAVGRWPVFRTPPGEVSRPAVFAAVWLAVAVAAGLLFAAGAGLAALTGRTPGAIDAALALLAVPAALAPIAVPTLGWVGVRQARASRERGEVPPVRGRRLGLWCAWGVSAAALLAVYGWLGMAAGVLALFASRGWPGKAIPFAEGLPYRAAGVAAGVLLGGALAAWLWRRLDAASRGVRPEPDPAPPGPRDTGAGLSRLFRPATRRDRAAALAACCAAAAMLAAAAWWLAVLAPAPAPRAAEIVEDPDVRPPTIVWEPPEPAAAPPAPVWGAGDLFEAVAPDGSPADPSALAPRVRLTDEARARLGLPEERAAVVSAAATAARAAWAAEFIRSVRISPADGGARFDWTAEEPAFGAGPPEEEVRRELTFYEAVDPVLDVRQQRILRDRFPLSASSIVPDFASDYGSVSISRRGTWYEARAGRRRTGRHAPPDRFPSSPEFPEVFAPLKPAVDRLARGEPAFPPVAEVAPPDAETAAFPEPDPAR